MSNNSLLKRLANLPLKRMGKEEEPAGLWVTSLPWPRALRDDRSLEGRSTYVRPLGQWPGEPEPTPRRLLMVADGGDTAPPTLHVREGLDNAAALTAEPPSAEAELMARSDDPTFIWEQRRLRIEHNGKRIAIAMGLRTDSELHWWEACRLVTVEHTPACRVVEMAGAIPLRLNGREELRNSGYNHPFLHKHNWLYGKVMVRLHANGVCEVYAHHINSSYVDDGADLSPAVPVVGLWTENLDEDAEAKALCGTWDGSRERFEVGGVKFDMAEVARLATPEKPGRVDLADGMLVLQPYLGCELYGGLCPEQRTNDPFILHAEDQTILRGMARTLRFSLSLSDRPPRIARYVAPAWWYGLCEEFLPEPLLPVFSEGEKKLEAARAWIDKSIVKRGFEDGSVPRNGKPQASGRCEPGWEGEIPYAQFIAAWRYGDGVDYDNAMRSAYHFTDLAVDHARNRVRMHGFPPVAFAIPMNRVQGPIAAFLETGDDYLLEAAEGVVEASYRQHRNAWPRMAVGRDACFVRGAVMLYRYFANEHFRKIAYSGALDVAQSQRPNGSFGDQGGGSGIHQFSGYITKPWMGTMATKGLLDYLELFPDEPVLVETVKRFADWLMSERTDRDGVMSWGYQHDYDGNRTYLDGDTPRTLPSPGPWHMESLARVLGWCSLRFGEPAYLDAWAESFRGKGTVGGDHGTAAIFQFLPWIQAKLWQTTIDDRDKLHVHAVHFGPRTPATARVQTPNGEVTLAWTDDQHVESSVEADVTVHQWSGEAASAQGTINSSA